MKIWWVGNLLLFVVVIPAVLALLNRTVTAILDMRAQSDGTHDIPELKP